MTTRRLTFEPGADWVLVPQHIRPGIINYVNEHREQGDFLMALFRNDLHQTLVRADDINLVALRGIMQFVWMNVPAPAWGSPEKVQAWLDAREEPPPWYDPCPNDERGNHDPAGQPAVCRRCGAIGPLAGLP